VDVTEIITLAGVENQLYFGLVMPGINANFTACKTCIQVAGRERSLDQCRLGFFIVTMLQSLPVDKLC